MLSLILIVIAFFLGGTVTLSAVEAAYDTGYIAGREDERELQESLKSNSA